MIAQAVRAIVWARATAASVNGLVASTTLAPSAHGGLHLTRRHPVEGGMGTKHQQDAQMPVAQLRDSSQPGLAAGHFLFWRETAVSAANSHPQANRPASGRLAQRQAAISSPMPGMVARVTLVLSRRWAARTRLVKLADLGTEAEQRCNHGCKRRAHRRWQAPRIFHVP